MIAPVDSAFGLHIENLPDGVRYVLPRRPREWGRLLGNAVLAFVFCYAIPIMLVVLVFQLGLPKWLLFLAAAHLIIFGLVSFAEFRLMGRALLFPDIDIEVKAGGLHVNRRVLWQSDQRYVPLREVRCLAVRSLLDEGMRHPQEHAPEWSPWQSLLRSITPTQPVKVARAEKRKSDLFRFFGTLILEGADGAQMLIAEEFGQHYLLLLANDLAARINYDQRNVSVRQVGPGPTFEPVGASRTLSVPEGLRSVSVTQLPQSIVIRLGPSGPLLIEQLLFGLLVFSGVGFALFISAGLLGVMRRGWHAWFPLPDFCFVASGAISLRYWQNFRRRGQAKPVIEISDGGCLSISHELPNGGWNRLWSPGQVAALMIDYVRAGKKRSRPLLRYNLVLFDSAMQPYLVLEERPEKELVWLASLLHRQLGLGI